MNGKDIKFAREYSFTLKLEEIPQGVKPGQELAYRVLSESILIEHKDESYLAEIIGPVKSVLETLSSNKDNSILRVDVIRDDTCTIQVTLLCFYQKVVFKDFIIVVDHAIHSELRKRNIDIDRAVNWIKSQIVFSDKYAFALGIDKKKSELRLLGKDISVLINEAPQGYLHIVDIRNNRGNNNEGLISIISGNISIEDRITEKAAITAEFKDRYNALIRDNVELINLWRIYDSLEMEATRQDALSMGNLKYRSFKRIGDQIVFSLDGCYVEADFLRPDMYYVALPAAAFNPESPLDYDPKVAAIVGTEYDPQCVNTAEFRVLEDALDDFRSIPEKGYLLPSISGSVIQSKRRKIARDNILAGKNQMPGLNVLLQSGEVVGSVGSHRSAVTDSLRKYIFGGVKERQFLDRQKKAIEVAVNTPDIALIQGPPGTGKTLVIRSIVQRINELENGNAKILVASTQHDAVDNAIKDMTYGGVPVNRAVSKLRNKGGNLPIYQWIDTMIDSCDNWLSAHSDQSETRFEEIFSALDKLRVLHGNELQTQLSELYEMLMKHGISPGILSEVQSLAGKCTGATSVDAASNSQLEQLLSIQITEPEGFIISGKELLVALERYLKYECDVIAFNVPDYWKRLKRASEVNEDFLQDFAKYKTDLDSLSSAQKKVENTSNNSDIGQEVESLIAKIECELTEHNQTTTPESELYNLIWTFKHELSSTANVKNIISAYSQVNAATCQQAANKNINPGMNGFEDAYDYVIIDEAARSNPLDLLIPMSMGKKIILVGDHKQLPHLVEREIVAKVVEKTKDEGATAVLEESLFMRLFSKVREVDSSAGTVRTCVLNEQFRMHPAICDLINIFYQEEQLKSACSAEEKAHSLGLYNNKPLAWIDIPAGNHFRYETPGQSKSRPDEIKVVNTELRKILAANSEYTIGVISFYSKQASMLRASIDEEFPEESYRIEVGTVDAFQGKEFDVVILSTVRSNNETDLKKRVGFLDDNNRLCVAFSRAKRLLLTVGDSQTVASDESKVYVKALDELLKKCREGKSGYYERKTI